MFRERTQRERITTQFTSSKLSIIHGVSIHNTKLDLRGFSDGDTESTRRITELVRSACLTHGLFQVINHGVDPELIESVHDHVRRFFGRKIGDKIRVQRRPGSFWGYSVAHADRFCRKLPWKETVSCCFGENGPDSETEGFFRSAFGEEFEQIS